MVHHRGAAPVHLFRPDGAVLREKTVRYPTRLAGLGAEQGARAWWLAATEALPGVVGGRPVSGAAITCQVPTLVCVDGAGEPLGAALTWIDRRAGREAGEISAAVPGLLVLGPAA